MDQATTPRSRTVALLGASGSGKTTLTEALLHRAGAIPRAGRVEDGSTVSDHEPEEIARGVSLTLGVAPLRWRADDGHEYDVTLLDTPGPSTSRAPSTPRCPSPTSRWSWSAPSTACRRAPTWRGARPARPVCRASSS